MANPQKPSTARPSAARPAAARSSPSRATPQGAGSGAGSTARNAGFFQVQLRERTQFSQFRTEKLDAQGRIQRIAGQRAGSSAWTDQELQISKECAHIENHRLIADTDEARRYLGHVGPVEHVGGDIFRASQQERELQEMQSARSSSTEPAPQRRAQSMQDKEREALGSQKAAQREQERPSPSGLGKKNPPQR